MSTKPMKPLPGGQPPQQEISIEDTESIKCDDCGNYSFIKSYFIIPKKKFFFHTKNKNKERSSKR